MSLLYSNNEELNAFLDGASFSKSRNLQEIHHRCQLMLHLKKNYNNMWFHKIAYPHTLITMRMPFLMGPMACMHLKCHGSSNHDQEIKS
jgi:hypothetical protein